MGQIAQAASNPNTYAPDPSGFNKSEWGVRLGAGAAKGLGQGMQNMQQQPRPQGAGGSPVPQAAQPQIQWPTFGQNPGMLPKGNNIAFYGGQ